MSGTTVKICGLTREETIDAICGLPIDQVGFIFAKSRRQVTPVQAGGLIGRLHETATAAPPLAVGVFVNPTMDELEDVLAHAPLDVIQLHGGEDAGLCRQIKARFGVQVYKVVSIRQEGGLLQTDPFAALDRLRGTVDAVLLDTHDPVYGGGSGQTFNWTVIPDYRKWAERAGIRLLVAGGLDPSNVDKLIRDYRPHGVDVSSGVETDGIKDPEKIKAFVERVKPA